MKVSRYICILAIVLIMTIFTIAEGTRTIKIGYNIAEMEKELKGLVEENKSLEYRLNQSKTLERISKRVEDLELGLVITNDNGYIILVNKAYGRVKKIPYGKVGA
ncbi:MAG: hypothetical protein D8M57_18100 [Candidatus Scalindua sp. AMX11]|nr:MAG: hypothetical protein DWQ00_14860 [Candidatus Scalindua sp.]NOG85598.1 hypothetical protein [Planctomycetota bacterium]RZV65365.1 MAG: hypothetical protein EX341_18110 [Candidatus Scalindua sp. SCAELEC01]TDE63481.1 MAG: hypothetical protein D8M57_18100 [Candidatus Scalindua sp. AMX11]GJQ57300.1 MAG: hypothetical protein SCALA701_01010 [Candidatus Scalindua sp.]